MIVDSNFKIDTKSKILTSKVWYGNPQIELFEGSINYKIINYNSNSEIYNKNNEEYGKNIEHNENELEAIKQFIWESNINNNLINSNQLCCINVPNKVSLNEFLNSICIYLSYIIVIQVFKSPTPNFFYIYLQFKNKEYANIFYNTFNFSKINPIEKEYYIFTEVTEIKFDQIFLNYDLKNETNEIRNLIPNQNLVIKAQSNDENNLCSICLDQIDNRKFDNADYRNYITGIIIVLCGHIFHLECVLKLDDDKCPLCRFNLSPANISACSLCTCEDDLWMCLTCGKVNCGEGPKSNDHRKEHYINSGHIYAKGVGDSHNITFDFTKNAPLHIWFQNSTVTNNSNLYDVFKDPKGKVEFIMSEYNSIISSQLESQRFYYIKLLRQMENSIEDKLIDEEIERLKKDIQLVNNEETVSSETKKENLKILMQNEMILRELEKKITESEKKYISLVEKKKTIAQTIKQVENEDLLKIEKIDKEILELQNQIDELSIHLKTLGKINKVGISGASIELVLDTSSTSNKKRKNKK